MALYTRKQYERDMEAIDFADTCLSVAVNKGGYESRIEPFANTFIDIVGYFGGNDRRLIGRVFLALMRGDKINGFQAKEMTVALEWARRKCKGKLMFTRTILQDNEKKPKCDLPEEHGQPCFCKNYNKFKLGEGE